LLWFLNAFSCVWCSSLLLFQLTMVANGFTTFFAPPRKHRDELTCFKKAVNIMKFLTNTKPIIVNPCLKLSDDAPNLTIV
jgi:hypothetical protein